jgi:ribosomal protein L12E/L44/L45/RPP1/RPP2
MKALFIRIFALTVLANSMLAFGASSPGKDDKMPATSSTPVAAAPQSGEDQHCDNKMKKEKKMKKKTEDQKQDDNYPGYGIFG